MNQQQIRKIKEFAEKLSGLCDGEAIPSHKYPDAINQLNSTNLAAKLMMYQVAESGDKAQRAYRERVLALLGDNTDYWVFIARIFEDTKPRWFSRLEAIRKTILLHTDPNKKYENWLRGHQGKLSPDTKLRSEIERLAEELLYEAKQPTETSGGNAEKQAETGQVLKRAGKQKKKGKPSRAKNTGFTFEPGQALFNDQDLNLPSGEAVEILNKLFASCGKTVEYKILDSVSNPGTASHALKRNIGLIRKALRQKSVPYCIEVKRGNGYLLKPKS